MTEEIKYCEDCKWVKRTRNIWGFKEVESFADCLHPETGERSSAFLVGRRFRNPRPQYCSAARRSPCGKEGKYWEPRK